ncbi:phenylacetate--CoA ligase family protein [Saccharothrix texasensis]|uniref:phenylacetate--CoA ligase family protein n=1 Tax=Saccharothrix texasensis TaxID=103734 RepID=UPI000F4C3944|nr:phenylacetate--CoA ligase family protein [Saccharothrix texasensis]
MTDPARLADLLRHARDHVPHYRRLLADVEITDTGALDVLRGLPTLTRAEVRAAGARLWAAEGDTSTWRLSRTSGTTGLPLEVLVDQAAQDAERAALHRRITALLPGDLGPDLAVFHLTLHAGAATRSLAFPGQAPARLVKWNLTRAWRLPDDRFLDCLREVDGQVVTGMPWVLSALADRIGGSGRVRAALVVMSGETVHAEVSARVGEVFGCPVTAMYVSAEVGIAGAQCEAAHVYHVSEDVVLELLDETATPADEGEVVLTSLTNRAMPLLRYAVGDRGAWVGGSCSCGLAGRRFRLDGSRVTRVAARAGADRRATTLDLAKLFTQLDLPGVDVVQDDAGTVVVRHDAATPVPPRTAAVIAAAVRGMLGPATRVTVRPRDPTSPVTARPQDEARAADRDLRLGQGPPSLEPVEVAEWARSWLVGEPGVRAAALTGSFLSPDTFTRHSDVDLTVVVDQDGPGWPRLAREMHRHLTGLRVNVDTAAAVADSPLLRARLLSECHPVLGDLGEAGVTWPSVPALRAVAGPWLQEARAVLWTQLTAAEGVRDPVRASWLSSRHVLNALRYHCLVRGVRTTVAEDVLAVAEEDGVPGLREVREVMEVAAEHRPPLPVEWDGGEGALAVGLRVIGWVRANLPR